MHLLYQIQEFIATDHRIAILKPPNRNIKIDTLNLSVSRSSVRIFQTLLTKTGIGDLNTIQTKSRPIHILSSNWGRQLLQSRTRPDCGVECFHVDEGIILGAGSDGGVIETERLTLEAAKRDSSQRCCCWDSFYGICSNGFHRTPTTPGSLWKHIEHPDYCER